MARPPESRKRIRVIGSELDVDLEISTRVETNGIDDPKAEAVEQKAPGGASSGGMRDGDAPQRVVGCAPRHDDQHDRPGPPAKRRHRRSVYVLEIERVVEPEEPDERDRRRLEYRTDCSRRTEIATRAARRGKPSACELERLCAGDRLDLGLEKTAADKVAVESGNHDYAVSTSSSVGRSAVIVAAADAAATRLHASWSACCVSALRC
jgi:hypothetical protein